MSLYFRTLFSGSDGNSTFVSDGHTHLLIDAGMGVRAMLQALQSCGIAPQQLSAILVTHEHSDHVRAVDALSSRYDIPVYASEGTLSAMEGKDLVRTLAKNRIAFLRDSDFYIDAFNIQPFPVAHDTAQPCGFCIVNHGKKIVFATDMGHTKPDLIGRVCDADLLLLESNYDIEMLQNGPYPSYLKARISGNQGHLSNVQCAQVVQKVVQTGSVRRVLLGHLSSNNNTPELAWDTCAHALRQIGARPGREIALDIAPRSQPGQLLTIE